MFRPCRSWTEFFVQPSPPLRTLMITYLTRLSLNPHAFRNAGPFFLVQAGPLTRRKSYLQLSTLAWKMATVLALTGAPNVAYIPRQIGRFQHFFLSKLDPNPKSLCTALPTVSKADYHSLFENMVDRDE